MQPTLFRDKSSYLYNPRRTVEQPVLSVEQAFYE